MEGQTHIPLPTPTKIGVVEPIPLLDLIRMKCSVGRPKDLEDCRSLIKVNHLPLEYLDSYPEQDRFKSLWDESRYKDDHEVGVFSDPEDEQDLKFKANLLMRM